MTGYVLRRAAVSLGLLTALLAAAGALLLCWGAPVWMPFVVAFVVVTAQWAVSPYLVQWLIPAAEVEYRPDGYITAHAVGDMVERRCREAGVRPVRLGIVDDGAPNAFIFGHTRNNAPALPRPRRPGPIRLRPGALPAALALRPHHLRRPEGA